ncbi:MAG: FHA domain-containing protein, partial [Planctomycetota bacterium]
MDLIAQGELPQERWRRPMPDTPFVLGREAAGWATAWDDLISRRHVELHLSDDAVTLRKLEAARTPVFGHGAEVDEAVLEAGEHFVIGRTRFTISGERVMLTVDMPQPAKEQQFSRQFLNDVRYRDADKRIDVLSRLPDLIQGATDDRQLFSRVVNVLLTGISRSDRAAIVDASDAANPQVLHWDSTLRAAHADFQPSQRLILQAIETEQSVLHQWAGENAASFTQRDDSDWAFCIPVPGEACDGWVLYLAGCSTVGDTNTPLTVHGFQDDMKFAQSAAAMLGNLREVRKLERGNAALGQFFSPLVMNMLAVEDPDKVLAPRETHVSVMFCDLRGF